MNPSAPPRLHEGARAREVQVVQPDVLKVGSVRERGEQGGRGRRGAVHERTATTWEQLDHILGGQGAVSPVQGS